MTAARRGSSQAALALALALASPGCRRVPATQLVVAIDSDIAVPGELAEVVIEVRAAGDRRLVSQQAFPLGRAADRTRATLPLSFGVVPLDGDAARRIEVLARAELPNGARIVRRALTGFLEDRALFLPMYLARRCVNVTHCADDQTCIDGECRSARVDPGTLGAVPAGGALPFPDHPSSRDAATAPDAPPDRPLGVDLPRLPDAGLCDAAVGALCDAPLRLDGIP